MFTGVRSVLVFSGFGFKPPASGFHLILTVASRLLHPYSTDGKTSRLMEERFSTVRHIQGGSQRHMEEKREGGDRGDQEEKRGNQKGREQSSQ